MQQNLKLMRHIEEFKICEEAFEYFRGYINLNIRRTPEKIKSIVDKLLIIAEENQYKESKAYCLYFLGRHYVEIDDINIAIEYGKRSLKIFEDISNDDGIMLSCNLMLICNYYKGLYSKAIGFGLRFLKLCEMGKQYKSVYNILINIAICYSALGRYKEGKDYLITLNDIPNKMDREKKIIYYQNLSEIEIGLNNIEEALKAINKAIDNNKKFNSDIFYSESIGIKAYIDGCLGNRKESEEEFEISIKMACELKIKNVYVNIMTKWGRIHIKYNELEKAEEKLKCAYETSSMFHINAFKGELLESMVDMYKKMNKYEEAFYKLQEYNDLKIEISKENESEILNEFKEERSKKLEYRYKQLYDEIAHLSIIGKKITTNLNIKDIFKSIYLEIKSLMEIDMLFIGECNVENNLLEYTYFIGNEESKKEVGIPLDSDKSLGVYCMKENMDILINDIRNEYHDYVDKNISIDEYGKFNAYMYCPLSIEDEIKGSIGVASKKKNVYTENDLNKLRILSSYVTIAIENGKLYNNTKYYANHDYLTGLLNRSNIMKKGTKEFELFTKEDKKLSIIMIDIDDFKSINDTYGHIIGDSVIKAITKIINKNIEDVGVGGRYGGEEFLIILPGMDRDQSGHIAEKMRKEIQNYKIKEYEEVKLTISQGVHEFSCKDTTFEEGIHIADMLLYDAKNNGKNRVAY